MEDILASIRRILSDDEPKADESHPQAPSSAQEAVEDDVLMLDASMMVQQERAVTEEPPKLEPEPEPEPVVLPVATLAALPVATLVAPEAAAAAASSVEALMRTLHTEQSMRVTSQGPTIEDVVRQEIRPLLKGWLDVNLPPLVERLVRIEIERVVGRVRT